MRALSSLRVLGQDHLATGRVTLYPALDRGGSSAALVISSGLKKSVNEDAGGWERFERRSFYAVADGHFGDRAAALAVDAALSLLSSRLLRKDHFEPERFRKTFADLLEEIERRLAKGPADSSETTLLAVASGYGRIFWGSFGDSRFYVAGGNTRKQVNRIDSNFLGNAARSAPQLATRMICGEARETGRNRGPLRLLLCTDGVPECRGTTLPEWADAEICEVIEKGTDVSSAAANLAAAVLRRGGTDNICAIVVELERVRQAS